MRCMRVPMEVLSRIEGYSDEDTRQNLLRLSRDIRKFLLMKYYGYVLYTWTSNLVYDNYKVTIHKNRRDLERYMDKNSERHLIARYVRFTGVGRRVVEEVGSIRVYGESVYILKRRGLYDDIWLGV